MDKLNALVAALNAVTAAINARCAANDGGTQEAILAAIKTEVGRLA